MIYYISIFLVLCYLLIGLVKARKGLIASIAEMPIESTRDLCFAAFCAVVIIFIWPVIEE